MIIGNPAIFAIEFGLTRAYENPSLRALGFFVIHVGGLRYGVKDLEATMMAVAFDNVVKRIARRGEHTAPFAKDVEARIIADAYLHAVYADEQNASYLGIPVAEFYSLLRANEIVWAPDGEEGFDDRSNVLHFDIDGLVCIIAFKTADGYVHDTMTLRDIRIPGDEFYSILQQWRDAFTAEWESSPKVADNDDMHHKVL